MEADVFNGARDIQLPKLNCDCMGACVDLDDEAIKKLFDREEDIGGYFGSIVTMSCRMSSNFWHCAMRLMRWHLRWVREELA